MDPITGGKVDGDLFAKVKEVYHELPEALRATLASQMRVAILVPDTARN